MGTGACKRWMILSMFSRSLLSRDGEVIIQRHPYFDYDALAWREKIAICSIVDPWTRWCIIYSRSPLHPLSLFISEFNQPRTVKHCSIYYWKTSVCKWTLAVQTPLFKGQLYLNFQRSLSLVPRELTWSFTATPTPRTPPTGSFFPSLPGPHPWRVCTLCPGSLAQSAGMLSRWVSSAFSVFP